MTADRGKAGDLDALVGDIEAEAAARRADPRFPIDVDARIVAELDRLSPRTTNTGDALAALVAALPVPDGGPRRRSRLALSPPASGADDRLLQVGLAVAELARSLSRRLDALEGAPATAAPGEVGGGGAAEGVAAWGPVVVALVGAMQGRLAGLGGRVWWSGPQAEPVAAALRAAGVDAYGTDPAGGADHSGADGRRADPLSHLRGVGDGALAAAVVAGPLPGASAARLNDLCDQLERCAAVVAVASPTPRWWRDVVGPGVADLGPDRPLAAETWAEALAGRGWGCRIDIEEGGRAYCLWAERPGQ